MLHYGDLEEDIENPPIEILQEKSELNMGLAVMKRSPDLFN